MVMQESPPGQRPLRNLLCIITDGNVTLKKESRNDVFPRMNKIETWNHKRIQLTDAGTILPSSLASCAESNE
jgi:hypothetical protein